MSAQPRLFPSIRDLPPGRLTAVVWIAAMGYAFIDEFSVLPFERVIDGQVIPGFSLTYVSGPVLLAAVGLVLTACRLLEVRPLAAYALLLLGSVLGASLLGQAAEFPLVQFLAPNVALYFIAAAAPRRTSAWAAVMALVVLAFPVSVRLFQGGGIDTAGLLAVALTVLVAWLLGDASRQARLHAEHVQAAAAVQAVTGERLRIARELHDVVAHSIGIVALQAGAARRVLDTQPVRAREALGEVENASRETLAGLRRMLGALREADTTSREAFGLADVDRLAEATTEAGVRVVVEWKGERSPLPPDLDMAAYRIVQESVTNAVRHSGAESCLVRIDRGEAELRLEVSDTGRGLGEKPGIGYGLVGMRERVALLHGEFTAGPRPGGGFLVTANLPMSAEAAAA